MSCFELCFPAGLMGVFQQGAPAATDCNNSAVISLTSYTLLCVRMDMVPSVPGSGCRTPPDDCPNVDVSVETVTALCRLKPATAGLVGTSWSSPCCQCEEDPRGGSIFCLCHCSAGSVNIWNRGYLMTLTKLANVYIMLVEEPLAPPHHRYEPLLLVLLL